MKQFLHDIPINSKDLLGHCNTLIRLNITGCLQMWEILRPKLCMLYIHYTLSEDITQGDIMMCWIENSSLLIIYLSNKPSVSVKWLGGVLC